MRVHFFNSNAVEKELSENRLDERARATYLAVAWVISIAIGYSTLTYSNVSRSWFGLGEGLSLVAVICWGFWYTFLGNGGKNGHDFIARFTCLLVPASIKANVLVWAAYYLLSWGFQASVPNLSFPSKESADLFVSIAPYLPAAMTYLANICSQIVVFSIIAGHLKRISRIRSVQ